MSVNSTMIDVVIIFGYSLFHVGFNLGALILEHVTSRSHAPGVLSAGRREYVPVGLAATSMSQDACVSEQPGACSIQSTPEYVTWRLQSWSM